MFNITLFLGISVTPLLSENFEEMDPQTRGLFISESEESYLKEVVFEENRYIGKFIGENINIAELHLLEKNIYSILNKMIPNYPFDETPLVLFAVPSNTP